MKKTLKYILLILILIMLFLIIRSTYSKYITQKDSNTDMHVSNWNIDIKADDLNGVHEFDGYIQMKRDQDQYIDQNVIAPTSSGTFEVTINSTGTESDFDYTLEFAEDVDTRSSYDTEVENSWGGDWNNQYTYVVLFHFDYSYTDIPIYYYWNTVTWQPGVPNYGFEYTPIDVDVVLPNNIISATAENCAATFDSATKTLTLHPEWYLWGQDNTSYIPDWNPDIKLEQHATNKLDIRLTLTYSSPIDSNRNEFWDQIAAGGKVLVERNLPDFYITQYQLNDEEPIKVPAGQTTISGEVLHKPKDVEVITKFKFYLEWYDGEDNILNNLEDVLVSKDEEKPYGTIPLKLKVTQKPNTASPPAP